LRENATAKTKSAAALWACGRFPIKAITSRMPLFYSGVCCGAIRNFTVDEIIARAIERALGRPMVWGQCDCCLWVADICQEMTGIDPAEPWRGRYASEEEAGKAMPLGLVNTLSKRFHDLKWPRIAVSNAKVGDIGIARNAMTRAAVVVRSHLEDWWLGRAEDGVTYVPPEQIIMAWSTPRG
jgi:hypothetical protein